MLQTHDPTHLLVFLMGGSALLLYGVKQITTVVEQSLGARLKLVMLRLSRQPLAAFASGALLTLLTQSSTATVTVLIGLVSAQLIPLAAAVVMVLGAAVGSTLVVQLLAFHITDYALEFLGLAAAVALVTQRSRMEAIGRGSVSFGFILVGLTMIDASSTPIADSQITQAILQTLAQSPLVLLLLGVGLSAVFVSSIAAIGIVMALAAGGALPLTAALAVTLGANIGTTLTPLLTAIKHGKPVGIRLGMIYTSTRVLGSLVAMTFLQPLAAGLAQSVASAAAQIAIAHFGFNLLLALFCVPLANLLANWGTTLFPDPPTSQDSGSRYLDPDALDRPAVALGQAMREVLRMADLAAEMLQLSICAFEEGTKDLPKRIAALDDQLDDLETAIKHYLIQLKDESLTEEQARRELSLLHISTELEAIGDIIDRQLMRLARRKRRKQIAFSPVEWNDLVAYHQEVFGLLQRVLAGLATQDAAIASDVLSHRQYLNQIKWDMHTRHLQHLTSGTPTSLDASAIHLEMVNAMSRILSHTCSIARVVQGSL